MIVDPNDVARWRYDIKFKIGESIVTSGRATKEDAQALIDSLNPEDIISVTPIPVFKPKLPVKDTSNT